MVSRTLDLGKVFILRTRSRRGIADFPRAASRSSIAIISHAQPARAYRIARTHPCADRRRNGAAIPPVVGRSPHPPTPPARAPPSPASRGGFPSPSPACGGGLGWGLLVHDFRRLRKTRPTAAEYPVPGHRPQRLRARP